MKDIELTEHLLAAQCRCKLVINSTTDNAVLEHVLDAILSIERAKQLLPKVVYEPEKTTS